MIREYLDDIWDFSILGASFFCTFLITHINQMLTIHLTPQLLSDFITLLTQLIILGVVVYKFKLLRLKQKEKKNGDSRK